MTLLTVDNLHTQFGTEAGTVRAVDGATFSVEAGEIVGLVGESGSGKSVTARSIIGLESPGEIVEGSIRFDGTELTTLSPTERQRLRGTELSMVFQDPNATLNPVFTVGEQIAESLAVHDRPGRQSLREYMHLPLIGRKRAWDDHHERAIELMQTVGIADPADRVTEYPHEFSGGMAQRAMLAIALASEPTLLLADEPTTALDTTTQAAILERIRELRTGFDTAVLFISHDLGVISELCDRVVVMYGGRVMEAGPTAAVLSDPQHPYTQGLLESLITDTPRRSRLTAIPGQVPERFGETPGCPFASRCAHATDACRTADPPVVSTESRRVACGELEAVRAERSTRPTAGEPTQQPAVRRRHKTTGEPLLSVHNVSKQFALTDSRIKSLLGDRRYLEAVSEVSLTVRTGETVGIVGESGSGKSTLANLITGLEEPTDGEIRLDGELVGSVESRTLEQLTDVGVVFQHPRESLSPRLTVRQAIAEPLIEAGWEADRREDRVKELLDLVDLSSDHANRRPHQLSGGQLQRVAIARAVAVEPRLVVLDEPVSALDSSVTATILNLLLELQDRLGLASLVISHDLEVVNHLADRLLVMYSGQVMERGPASTIFDSPSHPYTKALIEAIPSLDGEPAKPLAGSVPSAVDPPSGCVFHPRCPIAELECAEDNPAMMDVDGVQSACHFAEAVVAEGDTESETEDDETTVATPNRR